MIHGKMFTLNGFIYHKNLIYIICINHFMQHLNLQMEFLMMVNRKNYS